MLEFRLTHERGLWIADDGRVTARGRTLEELDADLARTLRIDVPRSQGELAVRMSFDNSVIPQWMRQYSNHYFNRVVILDLTGPAFHEEESR